jgi:nicotinate phosphoribosyltransferase
MGPGFKAAIVQTDALEIRALPAARSSTTANRSSRSPVRPPSSPGWSRWSSCSTTGSRVASRAEEVRVVTCERQREIVRETLDVVGLPAPAIEVDSDGYFRRVLAAAKALVEAVKNPDRIFEVGMRSASCLEQREIALRACREAGIRRTSNVLLARTLGMIPVGTMGHEHVQRFGADEPAFRAMRERRPGRSSYLLDTYDTIRSNIPAAFKLIREDPGRRDSIRYDSGDKEKQYRTAVELAKSQAPALQRLRLPGRGLERLRRHRQAVRVVDADGGEGRVSRSRDCERRAPSQIGGSAVARTTPLPMDCRGYARSQESTG